VKLPSAELSSRSASGVSFSKLARQYGVSPTTIMNHIRKYRQANLGSAEVFEDISLEVQRGLNWLQIASRSGCADGRNAADTLAKMYAKYTLEKAAAEKASKRSVGRPKKLLPRSAYNDFVKGRKTIAQLSKEFGMSGKTVRARIFEMSGPDISEEITTVEAADHMEDSAAQEIVETVVVAQDPIPPKGFFERDEIMLFVDDGGIPLAEIAEAFGLTEGELDVLIALDQVPAVEEKIEDALDAVSESIDEAVVESVPDDVAEPVEVVKVVRKRRGRAKQVFEFTDEQKEDICALYYREGRTVKYIAKELSADFDKPVTQTAIKEVLSEFATGRGRKRKELDTAELKALVAQGYSVKEIATVMSVSAPVVKARLSELKLEVRDGRGSRSSTSLMSGQEAIADLQRREKEREELRQRIQEAITDPSIRESIRTSYLNSLLPSGADLEDTAARFDMGRNSMLEVLTAIFEEEVRKIKAMETLQYLSPAERTAAKQLYSDMVSELGEANVRKIRRDLIEHKSPFLRNNPMSKASSYALHGSIGVVSGLAVDQGIRYFKPEMPLNKRNLISGGIVVGANLGIYAYNKDEDALVRAAGGLAGTLISRFMFK
jgi:transposase-like protein